MAARRERADAATIERLAAMSPCCRAAYVRGILAEKVRAHDHDAIRELGAILDRLRA